VLVAGCSSGRGVYESIALASLSCGAVGIGCMRRLLTDDVKVASAATALALEHGLAKYYTGSS